MKTSQSKRLLPAIVVLAGIALASSASAAVFLVDFSRTNGGNGEETASPTSGSSNAAANGIYWNNVSAASATGTNDATRGTTNPTGQTLNALVSTTNTVSSIGLSIGVGFETNGYANGGLNVATPALGALGIATATGDYYFVANGTNASLTITGLDPALTYNIGLFGTRNASDYRATKYTIGSASLTLQTSGAGAGNPSGSNVATGGGGTNVAANGNNDDISTFMGIVPVNNQITINVQGVDINGNNGGFGYLGIMSIEPVPEPSAAALVGLGLLGLAVRRRRA